MHILLGKVEDRGASSGDEKLPLKSPDALEVLSLLCLPEKWLERTGLFLLLPDKETDVYFQQ